MDSNSIIKQIEYMMVDCIVVEENENQLNRFNLILDLLNSLIKVKK